MRRINTKSCVVLVSLAAMMLLSGCTNWKKKYNGLNVQYQNLKGRLEYERREKGQLAEQVSEGQKTIAELQKQIEERNQTPGVASGFGDQYQVDFNAAEGTITVTLPNSILFSSGKADLKNSTSTDLDHIYSVLRQQYEGRQIDVVGHTDSDPIKKSKWADNWELSSQRALTVVRYLIKKGIPSSQIRAVGRGESMPVASNSSVSGKAKNRRVEIVVYMK